MGLQRQMLVCTSLASARRLLQGMGVDRSMWVKHRRFFKDIVPGWSDHDFKCNFRVSRTTFRYLVSELQPVLRKQHFLRSPIPVDQRIAITLWRLGTNVEYIQNH